MRPATQMGGGGWPKPGPVVKALLILLVVAYVIELLLLRGGFGEVVEALCLVPRDTLTRGRVWQVVTYQLLHAPDKPFHLIFNGLWLWMFGAPLESRWKPKRFALRFLAFGLAGALLTLAVAGVFQLAGIVPDFWVRPHVGVSGAVMGLTIAWGMVHADQTLNLFFLGAMKGRTFVLITVAIELLIALSYDPTSSTSHFGGMIGAAIVVNELWRPSSWRNLFKKQKLRAERRRIEHQLRVIDGGKTKPPDDDPKKWN